MWVEVMWHFGQKKHKEKLAIFTKIVNYTNFPCIYFHPTFYTNMSGYSNYKHCLQEESTHSNLMISAHFGLEVSGQFDIKNCKQKISNILKYVLNYTNFSWIIFSAKLFRNLHFTYYLFYILPPDSPNFVSLRMSTSLFST